MEVNTEEAKVATKKAWATPSISLLEVDASAGTGGNTVEGTQGGTLFVS